MKKLNLHSVQERKIPDTLTLGTIQDNSILFGADSAGSKVARAARE
jgi:hypothetical protein